MSETDFNKVRALQVLASVLAFPEEHRQESWFELEDFDSIPGTPKVEHAEDASHPLDPPSWSKRETHTVTYEGMLSGSCGTSACIAGWAALHEGWRVEVERVVTESLHGRHYEDIEMVVIDPRGVRTETSNPDFEVAGADALGLNSIDASHLFMEEDPLRAISHLYAAIKGLPIRSYSTWELYQSEGIAPKEYDSFQAYAEAQDEAEWDVEDTLLDRFIEMLTDRYAPSVKLKDPVNA